MPGLMSMIADTAGQSHAGLMSTIDDTVGQSHARTDVYDK